jgi:mRNA interferase MazF
MCVHSSRPGARPRPIRAEVERFEAGQIVIVDWRDALPKEANKRRPAVVMEDSALFDPSYPNVILVPLTEDSRLSG